MAGQISKAPALALTAGLCLLTVGGCASTTYAHQAGDTRIQGAFEEPFRDVSVMRENPPEVLIRAAEAPYALPGDGGCGAILEEMSALDLVLGPDLDAPDQPRAQSSTDFAELASSAAGSVIGLPFRSIIRRVSGAEQRAQTVRAAIFAGMVRRAFLRGVAHADKCAAQLASAPAAAADTPDADAIPQPNAPEPSIAPPSALGPSTLQPGAPVQGRPEPSVAEPSLER